MLHGCHASAVLLTVFAFRTFSDLSSLPVKFYFCDENLITIKEIIVSLFVFQFLLLYNNMYVKL